MNNQLALGLQAHQRGLLAHAVRRYRNVLRAQPDHSDALHLLGVALHQQGDHCRAADLHWTGHHSQPRQRLYHANMAEVYRALGHLDRAAECFGTASARASARPAYACLLVTQFDLNRPR